MKENRNNIFIEKVKTRCQSPWRPFWVSCIFFFFSFVSINAQEEYFEDYQYQEIQEKTFSDEQWQSLNKDLDYSPRKKKAKKKEKKPETRPDSPPPREPWDFSIDGLSDVLKIVLIIGMAVLLAWLFYSLMIAPEKRGDLDEKEKELPKEKVSLNYIEENLHQTNVTPFIKQAEIEENYALATRLHYLSTLKTLSEKKWINWQRDATNKTYLRQMRKQANFKTFRTLTHSFEKIWYGEYPLSKTNYEQLKEQFNAFKKTIN